MTDEAYLKWAELAQNLPLARQVAADPATPTETLAHLSHAPDLAVRALVASNPNTPVDVLQHLALGFPDRFFANPVLPLLLLEDPVFLRKMEASLHLAVLRFETMPPTLPQGFPPRRQRDINVQEALTMHVARVGEAGEAWWVAARAKIQQCFPKVKDEFLLPGFFPDWLFAALLGSQPNQAQSPDIAVADLAQLAHSPNQQLCKAVAANPRTPADALTHLAQHTANVVRLIVAQNNGTPPKTLRLLAADADVKVRRAVAYHPHTPTDVLTLFIQDVESSVRLAAVKHPRLANEYRFTLASDPSRAVRAAIAGNPLLPNHLMEAYAADADWHVRIGIAHNPALPETLRLQLLQDVHPRVRDATQMKHHPQREHPQAALHSLPPLKLAQDKRTAPDTFAALAQDADLWVRVAVASNKSAPEAVLYLLAQDPSNAVRQGLVNNPHTPFAILKQLVERIPRWLFVALMLHPRMDATQRPVLYQRFLHSYVRHSKPFGYRRDDLRLIAFASLPNDDGVLAEGAVSLDWLERFMVAMNQEAPRDTLDALSHDGNQFVRAAARQALG